MVSRCVVFDLDFKIRTLNIKSRNFFHIIKKWCKNFYVIKKITWSVTQKPWPQLAKSEWHLMCFLAHPRPQ